jgi:hypothetical protein
MMRSLPFASKSRKGSGPVRGLPGDLDAFHALMEMVDPGAVHALMEMVDCCIRFTEAVERSAVTMSNAHLESQTQDAPTPRARWPSAAAVTPTSVTDDAIAAPRRKEWA